MLGSTLKALANPIRRDILILLKKRKISAGEIANHFTLTHATISHHLSVLKKADLITEEVRWKKIYYHVNLSAFEEIMLWLKLIQNNEEEDNTSEKNE